MMTNLRTLVTAYRTLRDTQRPLVLATVVETLGSTYRTAGARMLITEDGEFHGIIGGGCFEGDLLERSRAVFATGHPHLLFYDMRAPEDELWGLGLGCNGAVRLLLERHAGEGRYEALSIFERCLEHRRYGVLATVYGSVGATHSTCRHIFFEEHNHVLDDWPKWLAQGVREVRRTKAAAFAEHRMQNRTIAVFCEWIQPPPHVLIIGAGPDAIPVVRLARSMDWEITLVDHRDAYADPKRFAAADRVLAVTPEMLWEQVAVETVDAAVLMTHNIGYDERFLRALAPTGIDYIGLLGPSARRQRLMDMLGRSAALLNERVSGPVGLEIGAKLPEEIALSIIAELVAHFRARGTRGSLTPAGVANDEATQTARFGDARSPASAV